MTTEFPWKSKVRQKDIDVYLENVRMKFIGYNLEGDRETLAGLPQPIQEAVRVLKKHTHTSLAELQVQREEEITRNPFSTKEELELTPTEILYQAMLPNLPQYTNAMVKVLFAATSYSTPKTSSIHILSDILRGQTPSSPLEDFDADRHKQIIVKSISAVFLLLLKHFKLNHIYQFEFMCQQLVVANCIPLILKFLDQDIMEYVDAINNLYTLDFPSCVIGNKAKLTGETLERRTKAPYSWRNVYSCINLLRILNKLTKWKDSRVRKLVLFKSAPILQGTLKVRHATMQLYALKLLKMQTKYLGKRWRKCNMETISAIYTKVRHRLNDNWAFGRDVEVIDYEADERALQTSVARFHNRRYAADTLMEPDYEPVDNNVSSVLGRELCLPEDWKNNYELWLEQEVFNVTTEGDKLLEN